ncbi:MAG TPA: LysR family transcriptional regulator [Dissulfurispiraceae bacterium]|nr:LysR family transcriptional regulator [Dissulfurispiraceae bacterium]
MRTKIWIEDGNGEVVFGSGRFRILSAIEQHGSIVSAARALGMSYRAVWGKIKATEERLGKPLLSKQSGGSHGGGSELTPYAKSLLNRFQQLQNVTKTTADAFFHEYFENDPSEKPVKRSSKKR